jgi:hypothetical protein
MGKYFNRKTIHLRRKREAGGVGMNMGIILTSYIQFHWYRSIGIDECQKKKSILMFLMCVPND